jgi:BirA family transcriptional regulator, biotin operon repressor / biotin---[acetyl-CoA-carboxylase] ligase
VPVRRAQLPPHDARSQALTLPNAMPDMPEPLAWGTESLRRQLEPLLPGVSVEILAKAESTNTTLIERARHSGGQRDAPVSRPGDFDPIEGLRTPHGRRSGDTQPCLLVAEQQTRGRGRMGRTWQSARGASLTFSLGLPMSPADWSGLSLAVGVALADALDPERSGHDPQVMLKWPNDLWLRDLQQPLGGRKLGGVLIETLPVGERRMCVVGVGLNILPQTLEDLSTGYACLKELASDVTAPRALAIVALPLVRALLRFEREGFAHFSPAFGRRDMLAGRRITTSIPDLPEGSGAGVDERGALQVRTDNGALRTLFGGEVTVRPMAGGSAAC